MLRLAQVCWILLIAMAGCSSGPHGRYTRPPNWTSSVTPAEGAEQVPAPPKFAPPPTPAIPAPRTNGYAEAWIPLARWSRETDSGTVRRITPAPSPTFALATSAGLLRIQTGSLEARWDGTEIYLGFKPQLIDGQPFVHRLDVQKNIEPLTRGFASLPKTNRVLVIDPGHGGENTGTKSVIDGTYEKEFTLDWAKRLAAMLATNGWQVFLTRTNDVDVPNSNRVDFAQQHKADLFISLHFNAPSETQSGVETYCTTPAGMSSTLTRGYDDDPSLVFPNNAFDAENLEYAVRLHRALLRVDGMADHGVRRARFMTVLRGQQRPAVLIEGGFLSNPVEARRIADPEYRQKLAEALSIELAGTATLIRSNTDATAADISAASVEVRSGTNETASH